jgi:membrane protein implicated in regulation of membrane protease activity
MQFVRVFVMLVGIAVIFVGLYLLVLGLGAPIEVKSVELGAFKASMTGVGAGFLVAIIGLVVLWLPMRYMKKTVERSREYQQGADGSWKKVITSSITTLSPP